MLLLVVIACGRSSTIVVGTGVGVGVGTSVALDDIIAVAVR